VIEQGDQVEATVQQLAELHDAHRRDATWAQRLANRVTEALGRPGAMAIVLVLVIFWMIGNYVAERAGVHALEEAPFPELGLILTVVALLVALLILTTQRHEQALAEKRSQLTLQIAILSERKIAKLIGMLDDLRIALPSVPSHRDLEAEEMAISADPIATMELIEAQAQE
jgi:uncharacterized membrane protein